MNEILNLENISVNFGGHIAVNELSLTIDPGTITGLIGPNGAGKTTLFNVISGLLAPSSGRVLFADRDITSLAPHKRARIGIGRTFQRLELFNSLTVIDNLRVSIETSNQWKTSREAMSGSSMNAKINKILDLTGLNSVRNAMASEIPTGQARLVELARALVLSPNLLLLDEPASGQNDEETERFGQLLRELCNSGISIFLVEHDMSLVMNTCDQVNVLDFGTVIAKGTPTEIQEHELVIEAYLGAQKR
ncbi:MAG: ABC transporter ATP-binding protein [Acidimicrobiaceae bacterium]|jgi:branched-chain amino acid transport system ATP-binding protein|nr:ABC transporter ATP-binding protein [Acidimicrobiaceae bacterium]|tara:strand:+ start:3247 stop:3993 length:747 start_codon:yes stop_codon:yes gene_type:complete